MAGGVSTPNDTYDSLKNQWEKCRDCSRGSDAVKSRGSKYLPMLDSHKIEAQSAGGLGSRKYEEYLLRALFYGATGRTIQGLSGAIFQKSPSFSINNDVVQKQIEDITLTDEPLDMFALGVTKEYLTTGRTGILVDMAGEDAVEKRPYWVMYQAEDIINWRFERFGGDTELAFVVLREYVYDRDSEDEFVSKEKTQYRVLRLNNGIYTQQEYKEDTNSTTPAPGNLGLKAGEKNYVGGPIITPTRRGFHLDFIPFSLPWAVNAPPLMDLVEVNLSHFRGSAQLKHGLHYVALPTPWVTGQVGDTTKPLHIGAGTAWSLEKDGKAGMLEFTGQGLGAIRSDMEDMERMMATLGARLLQEAPRYAETALSVSMRHGSDYATLRTIAQIVEQQLSFALKTHCWWLGKEQLVSKIPAKVELNKVFFDQSVTADELRALILALQGNTISYETFYARLANTGWTREGIDAEAEKLAIQKDGDQFIPVKPGVQQPDPKKVGPDGKPLPGSVKPPKPVN